MPWVRDRSRALIDSVAGRGYDVVGDLEELMPRPEDHEGYVATRAIPARQMLRVSLRTNAALLRIAAGQRNRIRKYRHRAGELPPEPTPPPEPEQPTVGALGRQAMTLLRRRLTRG